MAPKQTSYPSKHNWWLTIRQQVTDKDIENVHLALSSNKTIDPTKRHFDSNIAKRITFAIMAVYYKQIKGDRKGPFMKISFQKYDLIY
jgi:hypothetical protein